MRKLCSAVLAVGLLAAPLIGLFSSNAAAWGYGYGYHPYRHHYGYYHRPYYRHYYGHYRPYYHHRRYW